MLQSDTGQKSEVRAGCSQQSSVSRYVGRLQDGITMTSSPPAAVDLHLDGEGFDSIHGGGKNAGQHERIVSEVGRKGNAVFLHVHPKSEAC